MTEALIHNGLSQAEVMQTGLQVFEDPDGHEAVVRLYGKHLDEIEAFTGQIKDFDEQIGYFAADEIRYKEAAEKYSTYGGTDTRPENRFKQTIMQAIGQYMITSRHDLYELRDAYLVSGDALSRTMAEFLAAKLPDQTSVGINGQTYGFGEGIMATRGPNPYTVFGNNQTVRQFAARHSGDKVSHKPAETKDWLQLFENLGKVSLF